MPLMNPGGSDRPSALDLIQSLIDPRPAISDAWWAVTNPVDRIMGRGRAANGQMAFPLGGRYAFERLPNGFVRVDDRSSGLTALYDAATGMKRHGALRARHLDELVDAPPQPVRDPRPTAVYTAQPYTTEGRKLPRKEGMYGSRDAADRRAEELRREGVPGVRVRSQPAALVEAVEMIRRAVDDTRRRGGR